MRNSGSIQDNSNIIKNLRKTISEGLILKSLSVCNYLDTNQLIIT
jgi:hypothetical protein